MPAVAERTAEEITAIRRLAARELAARSFVDLLGHIKVRSDDPLNPVVTEWQPWAYLVEQAEAWASGQSEIDLKDRQLGYSWLVAAYGVWKARRGAAVAMISKGQLESRELLSKAAFIERNLPEWLQAGATARVDDMKFPGGGVIIAFPSTPDAGVSFTFQVVIMDEAHFHPYAAQNYAAIRPTISAGGQFIALSTADPALGPYGWFPSMYWASKRGETGYAARFVPWHRRPGRDQAWYAREKAAYEGLPEEFDAYYADTDAQAFAGRTGLVLPMFSEDRHAKPALIPLEQCRRVVAGLDLGGGDPTAISVLGLYPDHRVHEYHPTFYRRGVVTIDDIAAFLLVLPNLGAIECPPEQATVISTLAQTYKLPAHAANNKRGDGLNLMAEMLTNDTLTIDPRNADSINEFPGYRWAERTDPNDKTRYATKTPVDHHADLMDARRYALMEIRASYVDPGVRIPKRTITGRALAKELR